MLMLTMMLMFSVLVDNHSAISALPDHDVVVPVMVDSYGAVSVEPYHDVCFFSVMYMSLLW